MKERPILFSAPMVRAVLDGKKTQTRRLIRPQPELLDDAWYWTHPRYDNGLGVLYFHSKVVTQALRDCMARCSPYGVPGDELWVRETWMQAYKRTRIHSGVTYLADYGYRNDLISEREAREHWTWRPSIFMRRTDSRIQLRITSVRVERLQEISADDVRAEGVTLPPTELFPHTNTGFKLGVQFEKLWDSINAKRAPWASNPWVWVVNFERMRP